MPNPMPITEQRFREGSGERYLMDGRIRCQGLSKGQMRKYREEANDYVSPKEDLWPECQCIKAAEPGMFACRWHGGRTPKKEGKQPRSILDVMPIDMAEKMKILLENPQYLNRREDMALMKARIWQLMEELQEEMGGEEAWGTVAEARTTLAQGDEAQALMLLDEALSTARRSEEVWDEVRKNEKILQELTNTQVRTAKDLQQMATTEQVTSVIMNIYEFVANGAEKYIDDPNKRSRFLQGLGAAVSRFINLSADTVGEQITAGRDGNYGDAEHLD